MEVKIKKLVDTAVTPSYANPGDAGADLVATSRVQTKDYTEYGTGLSFEIPSGYVGLLFPRSSISKKDLILCNHVGVLDSGFRGEVTFRFKNYHSPQNTYEYVKNDYNVGDKIGQILIIKNDQAIFVESSSELSSTKRGAGGYGSSGK